MATHHVSRDMKKSRRARQASNRPSSAALPERIAKLLQESRWILLGAVGLLLTCALWGFDKRDAGWSNANGMNEVMNPTGHAGAWVADVLFYLFGWSAWWWVALLGMMVYWGFRRGFAGDHASMRSESRGNGRDNARADFPKARGLRTRLVGIGGFSLLLLSSAGLEALRFYSRGSELPLASGGLLGMELGQNFATLFGATGATLLLLVLLAIGWSLFSGMSWLWLFEQLGHGMETFWGWINARKKTNNDSPQNNLSNADEPAAGQNKVLPTDDIPRLEPSLTTDDEPSGESRFEPTLANLSGEAFPTPSTEFADQEDNEDGADDAADADNSTGVAANFAEQSHSRFAGHDEAELEAAVAEAFQSSRNNDDEYDEYDGCDGYDKYDGYNDGNENGAQTIATTQAEKEPTPRQPIFSWPSGLSRNRTPTAATATAATVQNNPDSEASSQYSSDSTPWQQAAALDEHVVEGENEDIDGIDSDPSNENHSRFAAYQNHTQNHTQNHDNANANANDGDNEMDDFYATAGSDAGAANHLAAAMQRAAAGAGVGIGAAAAPSAPVTLVTPPPVSTASPSYLPTTTLSRNTTAISSPSPVPVTAAASTTAPAPQALKVITVPREPMNQYINPLPPPDSYIPALDLLDLPAAQTQTISNLALEATSHLIEKRLSEFGVSVRVVHAIAGPVVTRFEIEPAVGVKGSQVVNLAKDLARALAVVSIRVVETIPGKSYMALELPNAKRQTVRLREVIHSPVFTQSNSKLTVSLGKDIGGAPTVADLAKMPHLLVAGTTGSGKSVGVNAMILSMLYKAEPSEVRLIMVDPKMLELSIYQGIPHLLTPVVTDMRQAANALSWCVAEMEKRYKLMSAIGVRNIAGLNAKIAEAASHGEALGNPFSLTPESPEPLRHMPFIVVIIDELADLMMVAGKKVEELIARLTQKARAAGIHLILATQRPSVDVITGLIKANIPTRIAFQVSSKIDSRTILEQVGAEALLGQGDMLYLAPGTGNPTRVHGAFVSDDEVHRVVDFLKSFGPPDYIEEVLESNDGEEGGDKGGNEEHDAENDPLYDQAVEAVVRSQRATISRIQREFRIGYNRSARLIEAMERAGIVSPPDGRSVREVLVKYHGDGGNDN